MSKLTPEQELNALHGLVAQVLAQELKAHEKITIDGKEVEISSVSPAMVAQAIKFLKDNNITSVPETDKNLEELSDVLKETRTHSSRLTLVSPVNAAEDTQ